MRLTQRVEQVLRPVHDPSPARTTAIGVGAALIATLLALPLARTGVEVKWVEPENLHVTLLFLGEVEDRALPEVCRVVQVVTGTHAPFPMSIETARVPWMSSRSR